MSSLRATRHFPYKRDATRLSGTIELQGAVIKRTASPRILCGFCYYGNLTSPSVLWSFLFKLQLLQKSRPFMYCVHAELWRGPWGWMYLRIVRGSRRWRRGRRAGGWRELMHSDKEILGTCVFGDFWSSLLVWSFVNIHVYKKEMYEVALTRALPNAHIHVKNRKYTDMDMHTNIWTSAG